MGKKVKAKSTRKTVKFIEIITKCPFCGNDAFGYRFRYGKPHPYSDVRYTTTKRGTTNYFHKSWFEANTIRAHKEKTEQKWQSFLNKRLYFLFKISYNEIVTTIKPLKTGGYIRWVKWS